VAHLTFTYLISSQLTEGRLHGVFSQRLL